MKEYTKIDQNPKYNRLGKTFNEAHEKYFHEKNSSYLKTFSTLFKDIGATFISISNEYERCMEEISRNVLPSFEQMASSTARCKQQMSAVRKINLAQNKTKFIEKNLNKPNEQIDGIQPDKIRLKLFKFEEESLKEFNSIIHMVNTLMIYHKNALYELEGLKPIIDQIFNSKLKL